MSDFDVVVAGAGPAGCVAARDLARAGLNVGLFDAGPRDKMTKTIILEAEESVFSKVDVPVPTGDEVPYHEKGLRVFSANGREAFAIKSTSPSVSLYLDRFVAKLLEDAESAGVRFFDEHKAVKALVAEGRVCGVLFDNNGTEQIVESSLVIDATGFDAALAGNLDVDLGIEFRNRKADEVVAENHLHDIDVEKAAESVRRSRQFDEEVWIRLGFAGPYSTEYSFLSLRARRAYILIGFKASHNGPPIGRFVDEFRKRRGYFAQRLHGGAGMIRISHSLDRLVTNGFMVIGEAACQVVPVHGSGVASALWAGHLAAKTAAPVLKSGVPTTAALWPYSYLYQKGRGATLAALDVSRLTVDKMTENRVSDMLETGIMSPEDMYNALIPVAVSMSAKSIPKRLLGLAKNPGLIMPIAKMGKTTLDVLKHYKKYPKQYDRYEFGKWKERHDKLFAPLYD